MFEESLGLACREDAFSVAGKEVWRSLRPRVGANVPTVPECRFVLLTRGFLNEEQAVIVGQSPMRDPLVKWLRIGFAHRSKHMQDDSKGSATARNLNAAYFVVQKIETTNRIFALNLVEIAVDGL